jgi:TATA-binding protein-associated factor Taf7
VEALLRARLLLGRDDADSAAAQANRALAMIRAPWWRLKAIRVLGQAEAASADLLEEARTIEAQLGIPLEPGAS